MSIKLKYLGHSVTDNGILPDPDIKAILNLPVPKVVSALQSYMNLIGFRCISLYDLTKMGVKFDKTEKHSRVFE